MKKKKQSLLWKLKSPQTEDFSYLFGTMHVRDEKAFHLLDEVKSKIDETDGLANEFHFADIQEQLNPSAMRLPEGTSIGDLLKPKIYKKLDQLLQQQLGTPIATFEHFLPLLISNFLAENLLTKEMPISLDMSLYQYAKEKEKVTFGIETYAEQIETLQKIPLKFQVKALVGLVKNFGVYQKETLKLLTYYEQSAIDKLYKSSKKSLGGMRKILLYKRNRIMADRIEKLIAEQDLVCAIGAAHLWGQKGVLRYLKQKGIQVKPC